MYKRPTFNSNSKDIAFKNHNLQAGAIPVTRDTNLNLINAAMPHRMSWKDIRDNTKKFYDGKEKASAFKRWTHRFIVAGLEKMGDMPQDSDLLSMAQKSHGEFQATRDAFIKHQDTDTGKAFLKSANQYFANVPDLGPHQGVNNVVGERAHLNVVENPRTSRSMFASMNDPKSRRPAHAEPTYDFSPMSRSVLAMSPGRLSGVAVDLKGDLIDVRGHTHKLNADNFYENDLKKISDHRQTTIKSFNPSKKPGPFKFSSSSLLQSRPMQPEPSPEKNGTSKKSGNKMGASKRHKL